MSVNFQFLEETFCHPESSEKSSTNAGVKKALKNKIRMYLEKGFALLMREDDPRGTAQDFKILP